VIKRVRVNTIGTKYRLCETCATPHYENCPDCYGWGVRGEGIPVSTWQAMQDYMNAEFRPCPSCGSTVLGPPEKQ
jgi:hypothetical protein